MNVLDLFSGIGGFSLGLERAGMRTIAFCEIDPYCRRVLAKHWPDVPCYDDIRTVTAARLAADGIIRTVGHANGASKDAHASSGSSRETTGQSGCGIDLICGGFPCQDISVAGKGAGIAGERSGLWSEYARIIGEVRPRYAIIENVAALLGRGLQRILWDLWKIRMHAEWHCIPACAISAPHRRDRVWIIAYRDGGRCQERPQQNGQSFQSEQQASRWSDADRLRDDVADADQPRLERWLRAELQQCAGECAAGTVGSQWDEQFWFAQSGMGRISNGVPNRVDRLRSLGNAVVPQIPELIGRAIMKVEGTADV